MATVATDDHEVHCFAVGHTVNLCLWSSENKVLPFRCDIDVFTEFRKMGFCLCLDLLLHGGEIHWDITTVGKTQGLDHVDDTQARIECRCKCLRLVGNSTRLFSEVYGQQYAFVSTHVLPFLSEDDAEAGLNAVFFAPAQLSLRN